jgi:hypothetical protein
VVRLPLRPREHVLETESEKFARRVIPAEWTTEKKEHDYGIDLQVEVVRNENVTGARFSIQLKGTDSLKVRKKAYIAHLCATSALFYYLQLPEPVVYLVYDAKGDQGYWIWIQEFIREGLDPNWKDKDEVTVRIPKENVFDGRAIKQIEQTVLRRHDDARLLQAVQTANNPYYKYTYAKSDQELTIGISPRYPGAELDHPIEFNGTFKFDQSEEGRIALEGLSKSIKTGAPIKLDSRFFEGFDFLEAFPDIFTHMGIDELLPNTIELLPIPVDDKTIIKLMALDSDKNVLGDVPYIELRQVQEGTEEITYSNRHQGIPLVLTYILNKATRHLSLHLEIDMVNLNIAHIKDFLHVHKAFEAAKYLKIVNIITQQSAQMSISDHSFPKFDEGLAAIIDDLSFIQEQLGVSFVWPGSIPLIDSYHIETVATALRTGSYPEIQAAITINLDRHTAQRAVTDNQNSPELQLSLNFAKVIFVILEQEISLGPVRLIYPRARFKESPSRILKRIAKLSDTTAVPLHFITLAPGIVQLLQWES